MNRPIPFLAVLALLGPRAPAQDPRTGETPAAPKLAWLDFARAQPGPWTVDWCAATGTPEAIFGRGLSAAATPVEDLATARAVAAAFLAEHRALLGMPESQPVELIAQRIGEVWVMVYDQSWRGLPVRGGRADVRLRSSGDVSMFGATSPVIPKDFDATPQLTAARAREVAFAHCAVPLQPPEKAMPAATLVLHCDVELQTLAPVHLAWEVEVDGGEGFVGRVRVDAKSGDVLVAISDRHACGCIGGAHRRGALCADGRAARGAARRAALEVAPAAPGTTSVSGIVKGWVNTASTPDAALTLVPLPRLRIVLASGSMPGINFFSASDGSWTVLTDSSDPMPVIDFYLEGNRIAEIDTAQGTELFQSLSFANGTSGHVVTFGSSTASEIDRAQTTAFWHIDDVSTWAAGELGRFRIALLDAATATVNDPLSCNAFYSAYALTFRSLSATCANTAYKSVLEHEWGHGLDDVYGGISTRDGLSEGNADIVAMFRSGDPVIAAGFYRDGRSPSYLRTGLNTRLFPVVGSVHDMGEVWMGCAWDLRSRLITSMGAAAGADRAEMLVLGSIAGNAMRLTKAVRELFLLDDSDANLCNGVPHYTELAAACTARSIPFPEAPCMPSLALPYGPGCIGTGGSLVGLSANAGASVVASSPGVPAGKIAIEFVPMRPLPVTGLAILSRSLLPGPTTASVSLLHYDAGDDSPGSLLAGPLSVTIGTTDGWYGASFTPPLPPLAPMTRYYLLVDAPAGTIAAPVAAAGNLVDAWFKDTTSGWSGPYPAAYAFRLASPPIPVPHMSTVGAPAAGGWLSMQVHGAPVPAAGLFGIGFTDTMWLGNPLPFDLGMLGAPGCPVLASWDLSFFVFGSSVGSLDMALLLPAEPWVPGLHLYLQAAIFDPPANAFGITASNGVHVLVGG